MLPYLSYDGYTGWRAVERFSNTTGFSSMTELLNMAEVTGESKFDKVTYTMIRC